MPNLTKRHQHTCNTGLEICDVNSELLRKRIPKYKPQHIDQEQHAFKYNLAIARNKLQLISNCHQKIDEIISESQKRCGPFELFGENNKILDCISYGSDKTLEEIEEPDDMLYKTQVNDLTLYTNKNDLNSHNMIYGVCESQNELRMREMLDKFMNDMKNLHSLDDDSFSLEMAKVKKNAEDMQELVAENSCNAPNIEAATEQMVGTDAVNLEPLHNFDVVQSGLNHYCQAAKNKDVECSDLSKPSQRKGLDKAWVPGNHKLSKKFLKKPRN